MLIAPEPIIIEIPDVGIPVSRNIFAMGNGHCVNNKYERDNAFVTIYDFNHKVFTLISRRDEYDVPYVSVYFDPKPVEPYQYLLVEKDLQYEIHGGRRIGQRRGRHSFDFTFSPMESVREGLTEIQAHRTEIESNIPYIPVAAGGAGLSVFRVDHGVRTLVYHVD